MMTWRNMAIIASMVLTHWMTAENLLKNDDFTLLDTQGRITHWITRGKKPLTAQNGVATVQLSLPTRMPNHTCGHLGQNLGNMSAGDYELSLDYRGELIGIFVVIRCNHQGKTEDCLAKWVPKKNFVRLKGDGQWNRFWASVDIPYEPDKAILHVEAFGNKNGKADFRNIILTEAAQ